MDAKKSAWDKYTRKSAAGLLDVRLSLGSVAGLSLCITATLRPFIIEM
jgi:hypothetical protein